MKLGRTAHRAAAVAAVLALTGCSHQATSPDPLAGPIAHGQVREDLGSSPLPDPEYQPLEGATVTTTVPTALGPRPVAAAVAAAATNGRTRADGEEYALQVAQVLTDSRSVQRGREVIDAVASPEMAPALRRFLIQDAASQRALGSDRSYDTSLEMWLRSRVASGTSEAPTRIDVEVVGNLVSPPLAFHAWQLLRVDVLWEDDHWALVGYSGGRFGPHTATRMTPAQRRELLVGPGWRRIPPA